VDKDFFRGKAAALATNGETKHVWHCIIPFYFGVNRWVMRRGGSPVRKKIAYLTRTVNSLKTCLPAPDIIIAVCDPKSAEVARKIHPHVEQIDCQSKHLCYASVLEAVRTWGVSWPDGDILMFSEDDQELFMSQSVRSDIERQSDRFLFSPHRWERLFWLSELIRPHRTNFFYLGNQRGIINNVPDVETADGKMHAFNHVYEEQATWGRAYAACWATQMGVLRSMDLDMPTERITLECATIMVFGKNFPVLKLLRSRENIKNFLVDHLSAYDYFRRILYLGKLFPSRVRGE